MKHILFLFIFCFINILSLRAQIKVTGTVIDTVSYVYLEHTTITVVNASDSILQNYTRANESGHFSLELKQPGEYIFIFSHPIFANFITTKTITESGLDFGEVSMISKMLLLKEVVINETRAITIKGDTTEYNADSFKVREFANVEELLKKLPGLEVDEKGNITAHGEKVQKMLVDGDEFFSDDPAVLSKMLRASAVDKVQVFDKKSEEAEFTGIDDGTRIKTINLKLKENAKAGYFGKVSLGGGLPDFWENQVMINAFKGKRKLSAYGIMSNTNSVGLGWNDAMNYSGRRISFGSGGDEEDDGGSGFSLGNSDFSNYEGGFTGQGLPKTWNGGVNYNNKFGKDENVNFSGNYRFYKNDIESDNNSRIQYLSVDTQYYNNNRNKQFNSNVRNHLSNFTEITIDSTSNIVVRAGAYLSNNKSSSISQSEYLTIAHDTSSKSNTIRNTTGEGKGIDANVIYRKRLKKEGRTLTANASANYDENLSNGSFLSENKLFLSGKNIYYDQQKSNLSKSNSGRLRFTYTEPLAEKVFLITNYFISYNQSKSENNTYDNIPGSEESLFNDSLSNSYLYQVLTNSVGTNIRMNYEKFKLSFGGNVSLSDFTQEDLYTTKLYKYRHFNLYPRASLSFGKNRMNRFEIRYNGATRQPTINQLQPIIDNNDPLNIMVGNPDLKQEFRHSLNINFGKYKVLEERYLYGGLGATLIDNSISQKQNITPDGIRQYQYVNLDGNFNTYIYSGYSFKIKPINTRVSFNLNGNYYRNNSILNDLKITSNNISLSPGLQLSYDKDTTLFLSLNMNPSWNSSTTTNSKIENNYLSYNQSFNVSYKFKNGIEIGSDTRWQLREKIDEFDLNNNVFLWHAYVSKQFLKDRSLVLKLSGNDILNQNNGFSRYEVNNQITQNTYNTISRYFMLHLTWHFTKSKAIDSSSSENTSTTQEADTDPDSYNE